MQRGALLLVALFFAGGLGVGFWLGRSPPALLTRSGVKEEGARPPTWEEIRRGIQALRDIWDSAARPGRLGSAGERRRGGEGTDGGGVALRTREESLLALREALASGNRWEARMALRDLERGGEPLSPEQLQELGGLLGTADRDLLHDLCRALVVGGGSEGLPLVMGFLEDSGQSLDRRRQVLEALAELPPEKAAEAVPALAEFLEKGPPPELERTAASAIGRLAREKGVETLLGLLESHPGIRAEAIFDAVGDVGGPGDSKTLLALLGGDLSQGERMSLLRSSARLTARGGDASALLGLLREPPAGVSREMVAQALGDASRDLGMGLLGDALRETAGDSRAQEAIARALVWQGGREGLQTLLDYAASTELEVDPKLIARALDEFQGESAVPLMLDLLRSNRDQEVLEPIARSLARNASAETLQSLLDSGLDAWQRRAVARAIEDGGSGALDAERILSLLKGEKDQEVASSLARALSRFSPSALDGRAAELFQGATSPVERIAFAQMLESMSVPGTAEILGQQIRGETDSRAQWELARILGHMGDEGVAQLADAIQSDADESHRHALLWGLEASHRPLASDALALFVQTAGADPSPSIRGQAAEILGRQQDPSLIPILRGLLGSEQRPEVRERIDRAIRELEGRR